LKKMLSRTSRLARLNSSRFARTGRGLSGDTLNAVGYLGQWLCQRASAQDEAYRRDGDKIFPVVGAVGGRGYHRREPFAAGIAFGLYDLYGNRLE